MAQDERPLRRQDDYTFSTMSAEEARADAERYWLHRRAGLAKVKPFTLGFPDLAARYDPDQGGAPLGTLCCDREPDTVDGTSGGQVIGVRHHPPRG